MELKSGEYQTVDEIERILKFLQTHTDWIDDEGEQKVFEKYFHHIPRTTGETLVEYINEEDIAYRRLQKVVNEAMSIGEDEYSDDEDRPPLLNAKGDEIPRFRLPKSLRAWLLLDRAHLHTRELSSIMNLSGNDNINALHKFIIDSFPDKVIRDMDGRSCTLPKPQHTKEHHPTSFVDDDDHDEDANYEDNNYEDEDYEHDDFPPVVVPKDTPPSGKGKDRRRHKGKGNGCSQTEKPTGKGRRITATQPHPLKPHTDDMMCFRYGKKDHISTVCPESLPTQQQCSTDDSFVACEMPRDPETLAELQRTRRRLWPEQFHNEHHTPHPTCKSCNPSPSTTTPLCQSCNPHSPDHEDDVNVIDHPGCAILDSGATCGVSSLVAADAIQEQRLRYNEAGIPSVAKSDKRFRFGDGGGHEATLSFTQPITAGILKGEHVDFHLIDKEGNETKPLLPISEMRRHKMVVDFELNKINFKTQPGVWHTMPTTNRGLLLVPLTQEAVDRYQHPQDTNNVESQETGHDGKDNDHGDTAVPPEPLPPPPVSSSSSSPSPPQIPTPILSHPSIPYPHTTKHSPPVDSKTWSEKDQRDVDRLLSLPPVRARWIENSLDKYIHDLEKDVAYLLHESSATYAFDLIEMTSRYYDDYTSLITTQKLNHTIWSYERYNLSRERDTDYAIANLMQYPPRHLWFSLPSGPSYISGYSVKEQRRWICNMTRLAYAQLENNGFIYLEAPDDSGCWNINDKNFQYLLKECTAPTIRDMCFDGLENDQPHPVQRTTKIYTNNFHFFQFFQATMYWQSYTTTCL